jgi:Arc/MetJ-type ribon-helix-helix transcriptional regulator
MNIDVVPELEKMVEDKIANGEYNSTSALVSEAL